VKRRRLGLSTRAIHGDPKARADWTAVAPPLYQSATFTNPVGSSAEVLYSRYGNNPNQVEIGKRLALLEGADAALFTASGMGAVALAHLAVLRPGDHLLASEWIYGGVHRLFREEFGKLGIDVSFVTPTQARAWKRAMRKTTRAVFLESPTNPLMRVIDLEPVATLCKAEGLALIVDSTFASPINLRPLEHGAGRLPQIHAELVRDDMRERGLAQPRRAEQQRVIERFATLARRGDEDLELCLDPRLADVLGELARPHGAIERLVLRARYWRDHTPAFDAVGLAHRSTPRSRCTRRNASRISSSVVRRTASRSWSIFTTSAGL